MSRMRIIHTSAINTAYRTPWAREHLEDYYVKLAHKDGYRCRSAYKLLELQQRFHLLKPNISVIDLGASPGSWSQVAADIIFKTHRQLNNTLIAVDIQPIDHINNVTVLSGHDMTLDTTRDKIKSLLPSGVEVVMSDMAPSPTGIKDIDNHKIIELCRIAMSLAKDVLVDDGAFVCKVWQSSLSDKLQKELSDSFKSTQLVTTKATKKGSREKYIVSRGFKVLGRGKYL
ncbi:Ribosomal RNA methyltransferase CG11447-like [Oopsacas minuta]|uniref:rRNA methyltransferase 2, mitochondrial n=1 Tax=Oopsacas minuta TaxID=111878 RepID=A0AAV7K683_9METZ|nr:Ribosomal RNA methyltransferase CG11447-like [Oopsacas minuta]